MNHSLRGITLLIAIIFASVVLTVSLALLDISYKQVILASSAKQSQNAFYSADSAMECALYWDQQQNAFSYTASPLLTSGISCVNQEGTSKAIAFPPNTSTVSGTTRTTIFSIPCNASGSQASVRIEKTSTASTTIFTSGYSTCDSTDPRRIERGLKSTYAGS